MSVLSRPDGAQFVVQAYREPLATGRRSVLVQRLRLLAAEHGNYLLLSLHKTQTIEAVFSREPGYLLGEAVWQYFDRPEYLIFCERLSHNNEQVLLVVVRNGEIYLDKVVNNDALRTELLPLMSMKESFRVITDGQVALNQAESEPDMFALPKALVSSFEIAKGPVFNSLPLSPDYQLSPLVVALRSPLLGSRISPATMVLSAVAVLIGAWWLYAVNPPTPATVIMPRATKQDDSYLDFYRAMQQPSPAQRLDEMSAVIQKFYDLLGWQASVWQYAGSSYHVQLVRDSGTLQWLMDWANRNHYSFNLGDKRVDMSLPSTLSGRARPTTLYPIQPMTASLVDHLDQIFPNRAIALGATQSFGQTKSRTMTIHLTNASPDTLALIGEVLGDDLPLSVTSVDVNMRAGLLSGSIQLSVWGI